MDPFINNSDEDNFEAFVNQDMFLDNLEPYGIISNSFSNLSGTNVGVQSTSSNTLSHSPELQMNSTSPSSWGSNNILSTPKLLPNPTLSLEEWNSVYQLGLINNLQDLSAIQSLTQKYDDPSLVKNEPIFDQSLDINLFPQVYMAGGFNNHNNNGNNSSQAQSSEEKKKPLITKGKKSNNNNTPRQIGKVPSKQKGRKEAKNDFHPIRDAYKTLSTMPNIAPKPGPAESTLYVPLNQNIDTSVKIENQEHSFRNTPNPNQPDLRQVAMTKRQERLIKNRAAALNSRKRKREQVLQLENDNVRLNFENSQLKSRIQELELMVLALGGNPNTNNTNNSNEFQAIQMQNNNQGTVDTTTTSNPMEIFENEKGASQKPVNVIFMLFFFSFVLFSYPSVSLHYNSMNTLPSSSYNYKERVISEPVTNSGSISSYNLRNAGSSSQYIYSKRITRASDMVIDHVFSAKQQIKQETNTQELFNYVKNNFKTACAKDCNNLPPKSDTKQGSNITDIIPFIQESKVTYLYASNLRSFIPRQTNTKDEASCEKPTIFSVLTPWIDSNINDERYLRINMQLVGTPELVNGKDLIRH